MAFLTHSARLGLLLRGPQIENYDAIAGRTVIGALLARALRDDQLRLDTELLRLPRDLKIVAGVADDKTTPSGSSVFTRLEDGREIGRTGPESAFSFITTSESSFLGVLRANF